jgi:hypothetical protein
MAKPRTPPAGDEPGSNANARHKRFARLVAMGASQTQAYMEAFNSKNISSAMTSASRLMRNDKVRAQVRKFRQDIANKDEDFLEYLQDEARDLYTIAKETGDLSAANAAFRNLAQITGNWKEIRQHEGAMTFEVHDKPLSEEEWERLYGDPPPEGGGRATAPA